MKTELVRYNEMRTLLAQCAKVDEVKEIHDKAKALEAYYKQRNDKQAQAWFAQIKMRAKLKIAELSKALDKRKPGPTKRSATPLSSNSKKSAQRKAGLNPRTAQRYEALADGGASQVPAALVEDAKAAVRDATDIYLAEAEEKGIPVTERGLRKAQRAAVEQIIGMPLPKAPARKRSGKLKPTPEGTRYIEFVGPIRQLAERNRDANYDEVIAEVIAAEADYMLDNDLRDARIVVALVQKFIIALEEERNAHDKTAAPDTKRTTQQIN